ncbi:acetyl-CoA carboxylase biotin carboxyl carrier protein [Paraclostridium bifermentans]|uniref:acetyl-CoA carboxylase biotin carboxyl carrier protein n=1 Tax=Paraclostridium bifermentans TaxID=1490 RepID=UPI00359C1D82
MKINEIKELILTIDKTNLTYVNLKDENFSLEVSKSENKVNSNVVINKSDEVEIIESISYDDDYINENDTNINEHLIKAPIMGTYYASSSPDAEAFVKVGDKISKGDTLCIIEAMKLMNEITSDVDGEVIEICSSNEDLVEYNQVLFKIKTI